LNNIKEKVYKDPKKLVDKRENMKTDRSKIVSEEESGNSPHLFFLFYWGGGHFLYFLFYFNFWKLSTLVVALVPYDDSDQALLENL
jgi:hypothetical protein